MRSRHRRPGPHQAQSQGRAQGDGRGGRYGLVVRRFNRPLTRDNNDQQPRPKSRGFFARHWRAILDDCGLFRIRNQNLTIDPPYARATPSADTRRQPAARRAVHRDRALAGGLCARDQEPAFDNPAEHGVVGRGFFRRGDAARPPGAAQNSNGRARVPAAAGPAGRLPELRQGAAAEARADGPERGDRTDARFLQPEGRRRPASKSCAISIPICRG